MNKKLYKIKYVIESYQPELTREQHIMANTVTEAIELFENSEWKEGEELEYILSVVEIIDDVLC